MKAKDLDKKFDSGEDITKSLDLSKARRPGQEQKRVKRQGSHYVQERGGGLAICQQR